MQSMQAGVVLDYGQIMSRVAMTPRHQEEEERKSASVCETSGQSSASRLRCFQVEILATIL